MTVYWPESRIIVTKRMVGNVSFPQTEYCATITVRQRVDQYAALAGDEADRYISGYLCNQLREFVNSSTLDKNVHVVNEPEPRLVRCEECEHWIDDDMEYHHFCTRWEEGDMDPLGFCHEGARR